MKKTIPLLLIIFASACEYDVPEPAFYNNALDAKFYSGGYDPVLSGEQ